MLLVSQSLYFQDLQGAMYTYPEAGDVLPWHTHGVNDAHITIVARGTILMRYGPGPDKGPGDVEQTLSAGSIVDTPEGFWHEFIGLEPNSRIVNIIKKAPTASCQIQYPTPLKG